VHFISHSASESAVVNARGEIPTLCANVP
jgi:hypothetical protein